MKQLTELNPVSANNINIPTNIIKHPLSKKQKEREMNTRKWMDLKRIEAIADPNKDKNKGKGNGYISIWNRLQTEHEVAKEKYTCSSYTDYEKKNARYKFNHAGENMPVKRKSATSGIKQVSWTDAAKLTEKARLNNGSSEERRKLNEFISIKTTEIKIEEKTVKQELK